ncbi:hypothetical protein FHR76_004921 [Rhizobium sp. RAS22]|nr:hypothetical protein [Rhizobium sp. RAS22]
MGLSPCPVPGAINEAMRYYHFATIQSLRAYQETLSSMPICIFGTLD